MGTVSKDNIENQVPEAVELAAGYRILDYKVVRFIARGAFGAVYQVDHINTLPFALKIESRKAEPRNLKVEAVVLRFIHRDIKPANFCMSLENPRQLVMVDFGMCRKYVTDGGSELRHPRWYVHGFKGTLRYAPLAAHHGRESSRKEDLESVLYVLVELLVGTLPWMTMEDQIHVEHAKQIARTIGLHEFLSGCPKQLVHMLFYIDNLRFYDTPDYALLRGLLNSALENGPQDAKYEWEEEMKIERKKSEYLRSKEEVELEDG
ncbi:Protein CBG11137 [Caenorhabditis briggsae]|uniref:non-specific serine/threonine protein kinase n=1 Tax=Caenorhabditis briggsae TaxID=6238 RepID=A8XCJ2_CAEBR|nr:Protein CBG11137 [Caenorhabditis briggsae]CAP30341.2 Protein CBG11137 [Caenorhabditis briggsae]